MRIILVIFFISFSVMSCKCLPTKKHSIPRNPIELSMDKNAESFLLDPTTNALSIGIYKDGVTYVKHYGELDKGRGNKPTDETIYEIASVSKTFAGTLIAQAELDGRLNVEDDIRKYLKEDFSNLEYAGNPIRIKHLITHTSRLPKFLPHSINKLFENPNDSLAFNIYQIEKDYTRDKFITDMQSVKIDTIPGTKFDYSNADTELIAYILENIYNKPYDQLVNEEICAKIGMTSTGTFIPDNLQNNLANGYTINGVLAPKMTHQLWGASGGMMSTIPDMIKYIKFQLDNSNETAIRSHQALYEKAEEKIGYYWPISKDENNGVYFSHHGGAFGTQNVLFVIPEKNIGITIFTNQSLPETAGKLYRVMDEILKDLK